ncbi:MAG TPA: phage tail protein, partial [Methylomirabilota bacterium]|nr:phage tail protein [Methylomirabilota bacterium]
HGRRDDAAQRRYLETWLAWFDPDQPGFTDSRNPRAEPGGPRMLQASRTHLGTFDARPYPWFPLAEDVWSDGPNWATGHWLNGRLGAAPLAETVAALIGDAEVGTLDVSGLTTVVDGIAVVDRSSARSIVDALAGVFRFVAAETATGLRFADRDGRPALTAGRDDLVLGDDGPALEIRRAEATTVPSEVAVSFYDTEAEGRQTTVTARRGGPIRALDIALPVTSVRPVIAGAAEAVLKDLEDGRERFVFALPPTALAVEAGDLVAIDLGDRTATMMVERIEDGAARRVEARAVDPWLAARALATGSPKRRPRRRKTLAKPMAVMLDLPVAADGATAHQPLMAVVSSPWPGTVSANVTAGGAVASAGAVTRPATMGFLDGPLAPGPVWILDRGGSVELTLSAGSLAAISHEALLAGGNLAAVGSESGGFELIQFRDAELIGPSRYRIGGLIRGQGGTEHRAALAHPAGARFVLVDGALGRIAVDIGGLGGTQALKVGPADADLADPSMLETTVTAGGAALVPLSPVRLTARRTAAGDIAIAFIRRTRIGGDRFDAYEVPLGEAFEAYRIAIYDGGAEVRAIDVSAPAALYAAADEIADFGAPQAALDVGVRQISETVGPGRETRRTIDV